MQLSLFDQVLQAFKAPFLPPQDQNQSASPKLRSIALVHTRLEYRLNRSKRRTIGFLIDDDGLTVAAPKWVTIGQIEEALREREDWIARKSVEWRDHVRRRDQLKIVWGDGASIQYLGVPHTIRLDNSAEVAQVGVLLRDAELRVALPPQSSDEQIKNRVQSWLQARAKEVFAQRIPVYSERLGHWPKRWGLSSARTRWGSCGSDGSIRLNWRLVHFPMDVIDYVVAHELAHLKELNHGPDFWRTVGELFPDYEQKRRWLKQFPAH
jgi:predicted metal-dependent hydrolase